MVIQGEIDKAVFYDASEENVKEEAAKVLFETTIEEEDEEIKLEFKSFDEDEEVRTKEADEGRIFEDKEREC